MLDTQHDSLSPDAPLTDLGPLAWVFEELRKSLDGANKAIKRFVRESEQSRLSDLESVDPGSLRVARQQLHQAVGALEMVGLQAPAQVLRGMEAAVQRFVQRPLTCTNEAAGKVERASFALIEYLEAILNNKQVQPVALFSQYREVQELAAAERVHPSDLWAFDQRGIEVAAPVGVEPQKADAQMRSRFDRVVLLMIKSPSPAVGTQLARMSAGLSVGSDMPRVVTFWRVAAAYFEAVAQKLVPIDVYVKRASSRILLQLSGLAQEKTRGEVSETLLHDLLFFCSQALLKEGVATPNLLAVRQAFGLNDTVAVDYSQATLGRFDPALLVQARKRINAGKESWSLMAGGDMSRARQVQDQYSLIGDSLLRLHPASTVLARALVKAAEQAARMPGTLKPELSMEVATTTLYLEAAFEDFDPNDPELTARTQALAERLEQVLAGAPAQPLEPWMEQLYRRVSDRQTLGSVVGELKVALGEVEKSLDQFFRAPREKACLHVAVSQLVQMRGVLSVLGLDQAVHTVGRMRGSVEQILDTEVDELMARQAGTFQQLGNNLSALSFLVDMLNYQPALAKKLFVFDEESGELTPLMGRTVVEVPRPQATHEEAHALSADVQRVVEGAQSSVDLVNLSEQLGSLADQASLAEQPGVARAAREAAMAVVGDDAEAGAQALMGLAKTGIEEAPSSVAPMHDGGGDDDDDLLDIFLEEAREVVGQGQAAVSALAHEPSNLEHLSTLRRAYHTLKGSSRMVGLSEFGEAAWALEQALNAALAEQRPTEAPLRSLAKDSLNALDHWVEDIAQHRDGEWKAQPFRVSAQAWRDHGQYLPVGAVVQTPESAETVDIHEAAAHAPVQVETEDALVSAQEAPEDSPADFGEASPPDLDFSFDPLTAAAPEPSAPAPLLDEIDFDSLAQHSAQHTESSSASMPAEEGSSFDAPPSTFDDISLDTEAALPQAPELQDSRPSPLFHPEEPDSVFVEEGAPEAVALDLVTDESLEMSATDVVDVVVEAPEVPEAPVVVGADDEMPDEQTRLIGPLRIGIRLYNVYLNEADEWSRRLSTCLAEWALERHEPVPDQAEALAHSLAGSSATVGFQPLSDIARALEHSLASVALHQQGGQPATAEQAQLFVDAAEDIRRLLHQFAAGFFKEPNTELLSALDRLLHLPAPADAGLDEASETDAGLEIDPQWESRPEDEPLADLDLPVEVDAAPSAIAPPKFEPSTLADFDTLLSPLPPEVIERGPAQDIDDDIDVLDTIDVDLFPIFAEEAQELLPQLGGALRQWVGRPDNTSARGEVLRNLHTLKGSARLAGALRLGEMAHRMETVVERLGSDAPQRSDLEPLQVSYDALCARFDLLRNPDVELHGVLQTAPEQMLDVVPFSVSVPEEASLPEPIHEPEVLPVAISASNPLGLTGLTLVQLPVLVPQRAGAAVRVRPELLDRLVNQAGEVMITRSRMESQLVTLRGSLKDLTGNLDRLRHQLRDIELQAETQMQSRLAQARDADLSFDPLEFDRFTRVQELTRMMAESVNDVATVQRNLQRAVEATEDGLVAQARQTRELQRDLLRTRMVEFEGISERLYRVVRQASKETGKQVRLDITAGHIEMDRGVLDRMTAAFEHLLRNSVVHGIETPEERLALGKPAEGRIEIRLAQELNDVSVVFQDDGAGLDLVRLREKAMAQGLIEAGAVLSDEQAAQLIFTPGLSTANEVSSLAGRGVGMDVVRNDVIALGGRVETHTHAGQGTNFKLVLPLTTAVTQVVMLRMGDLTIGVPSTQVELVRRVRSEELAQAYAKNTLTVGGEEVPFYWAGALLQSSAQTQEAQGRTLPVVIFRSAAQRVAMHVDEVLGNQEVVVKNLGPQLSRLPGLAGMSVLASGAVALIYNPVALATVYGAQVQPWMDAQKRQGLLQTTNDDTGLPVDTVVNAVPLVLVVDDSITVRRVTQRLLLREGYRVVLAADGLQALERLQHERPAVVLSDIEMPRMDGFDLVRNIRSDPRLAGLPVIMITSRIAEKHREHARELGVDHYLGKPYAEDELLALVGHYVQSSAAEA
ncbi:Hpt domain-containing protein [Hydrogenophaga sp. A37]|uniref:hybrid sensor histidine kinase/response regulator n=1 Tax=Hydrogenophaga sp. A37 TaxID=1945864 RepID=UPI0009843502|nr:Hpt domain-containing protein [Hydrogenophaga sp. A37]OOG80161.1 hybrid sensor histidine kinase/response regulator [Hydrogenophaga sp. A37]